MAKVCDWGGDGREIEPDLGRKYGVYRGTYIGSWLNTGGFNPLGQVLPTTGASNTMKTCADNGTRALVSLRTGNATNNGDSRSGHENENQQDSYCGRGDMLGRPAQRGGPVSTTGFTILTASSPTNKPDPITGTGDRDGNGPGGNNVGINQFADGIAAAMAYSGSTDFVAIDMCIDHEADLWVHRPTYTVNDNEFINHSDKGNPSDYVLAAYHIMYKTEARWLSQLGVNSPVYKRLIGYRTGNNLRPDGYPYFRWTTAFAFGGINTGIVVTNPLAAGTGMWTTTATNGTEYTLSDFCTYVGIDMYSETNNRGFATGDDALTVEDDFEGNYTHGVGGVFYDQATTRSLSTNALCTHAGQKAGLGRPMDYGIWEMGCQRDTNKVKTSPTNVKMQAQADWWSDGAAYFLSQGTSHPHIVVLAHFLGGDPDDWWFPHPSNGAEGGTRGLDSSGNVTANWNLMNTQSRATWVAIKTMYDLDYFGGGVSTGFAPTLDSPAFVPDTDVIGATISIHGHNFQNPVVNQVAFNGVQASFLVSSDTRISCQVPAGATTGPVTVHNALGTATSDSSFTVLIAPTITSFAPPTGYPGQSVVITGTRFNSVQSVTLNGQATAYTRNSATQITFTIPNGATDGNIVVTTTGGSATSATPFDVTTAPANAPRIDDLSPLNPLRGGVVTITGAFFTGATTVTMGNQALTSFTVASDTSITFTVDLASQSGPVAVTTPSGSGLSAQVITITENFHTQAIYRDPTVLYRDARVTYRGHITLPFQSVTLPAIVDTAVVGTPGSIKVSIPVDLIDNDPILYNPEVFRADFIRPNLIVNAPVLYNPSITFAVVSITSPTTISGGTVLYAPQVFTNKDVRPVLITPAGSVFTPALLSALNIPAIQNFTLFYGGPTITQVVPQVVTSPVKITNPATVYVPTVTIIPPIVGVGAAAGASIWVKEKARRQRLGIDTWRPPRA